MKRITVYFGNYGSGKTELSINTALALSRTHSDVTLVDLDIVNPYFRSSEHRALLEHSGVRVIAPVFANTAVDVPALPPDVSSAFSRCHAVFDCGGDPVGASALGSLKPQFDTSRSDTQVLFVLNTCRPYQDSKDAIMQSIARIQQSARLKTDGFVLNTNLGVQTTGRELAQSYHLVRGLSSATGIPICFVSGTKEALLVFSKYCPECDEKRIEITPYTRPEWL